MSTKHKSKSVAKPPAKAAKAPGSGGSIFGIFGSIKKFAKGATNPQAVAAKLSASLGMSEADSKTLQTMLATRIQQAAANQKKG